MFACWPAHVIWPLAPGMLSHRVQQNIIADEKAIIQNPGEGQKSHKECTFAVNECYALDIIMSSGEGKARPTERKTTVYRKTATTYQLRMKTSRQVHAEISKKFTSFPFTVRYARSVPVVPVAAAVEINHRSPNLAFWPAARARTRSARFSASASARSTPWSSRLPSSPSARVRGGGSSCFAPPLVLMRVLRSGEFVAQFKALVLLLPNGNVKATFAPFTAETYKVASSSSGRFFPGRGYGGRPRCVLIYCPWCACVQSEFALENAELKAVLAVSLGNKNKKKKKAAKKDGAAAADPAAAAAEEEEGDE